LFEDRFELGEILARGSPGHFIRGFDFVSRTDMMRLVMKAGGPVRAELLAQFTEDVLDLLDLHVAKNPNCVSGSS
jgi:hypothetical protein